MRNTLLSILVIISILLMGCGEIFNLEAGADGESGVKNTNRGSKILYVGGTGAGNYTKIQDAVDNASNGDTVFVFKGIYKEHINVTKTLNLIGENRNNTIINGSNKGTIVNISANWVNISNFNIRNSGDNRSTGFRW